MTTASLVVLQPGAVLDHENHRYFLDGAPVKASVTERIDTDIVCEKFDPRISEGVFRLCARVRLAPDAEWTPRQLEQFAKHGKYSSPAEIARAWAMNRDAGTELHKTIELLVRGECLPDDQRAQTPEALQFQEIWRWLLRTYEFVAVETPIVVLEWATGGSIDAVCRRRGDAPDEIVLVDWKKMAAPVMQGSAQCAFFDLPKCKRAKHEIQLNFYATMVERATHYRVVEMLIVYFDAESGVDVVRVERRAAETRAYFEIIERAATNEK